MYWLPYSSHSSHYPSDSLPSLNLLCLSKADARFIQDGGKAVWSIPKISVAFFPSLQHNFIAYRSSKVFSRVYSNFCCSCSFEPEILNIGQSSHKMYSNNILNYRVSTTILNVCTPLHLVYLYIYSMRKQNMESFLKRSFLVWVVQLKKNAMSLNFHDELYYSSTILGQKLAQYEWARK